jgi:hypothetical protein
VHDVWGKLREPVCDLYAVAHAPSAALIGAAAGLSGLTRSEAVVLHYLFVTYVCGDLELGAALVKVEPELIRQGWSELKGRVTSNRWRAWWKSNDKVTSQ